MITKLGVPAPIARPRLINNSLPVVFNESRNRIIELQREGQGHETTRNATTVVIFVRPRLTSGDPSASRPCRRVAPLFDMVLCDDKFYCKSFRKF